MDYLEVTEDEVDEIFSFTTLIMKLRGYEETTDNICNFDLVSQTSILM